jgi:uncharacterized protein YbjT (DUF2867 family)
MKTLILGATGLVGNDLLNVLIDSPAITSIQLLSRRKTTTVADRRIHDQVVDFSTLSIFPFEDAADVLFIAFGTTLKQAGSKQRQTEIDVDIPTNVMQLAFAKGVKKCVLISSMGADEKSWFFYPKMKAQLDNNATKIGFEQLIIIQPSFLDGPRNTPRMGEKIFISMGYLLTKFKWFKKYAPVKTSNVAKCMIQSTLELPNGIHVISSSEIDAYAKRYSIR